MDRKGFLQTFLLLGSSALLASFEEIIPSQDYTRDQLIGKGNPDISGNDYLSTMHRETAIALQKMQAAASKENINIEVVSAYRSFQRQKEIFESKYQKNRAQGMEPMQAIENIIEYSTIPGTSRHHWGTDLDLIDGNQPKPSEVLVAENFHGKGPFCKMKQWMDLHAHEFGFYEVYTHNGLRKGFHYEPWHFSYAPVSIPMLRAYAKLDLKNILQEEKILGGEYFTDTFLEKYRKEHIFDINPKLL
jgi:LAS superfamily LD-carboxypeptidase LdcB